jgi:hypothetical protein
LKKQPVKWCPQSLDETLTMRVSSPSREMAATTIDGRNGASNAVL